MEKIRRRDTSNHTQVEADLDDVLDAMEKLDGRQVLPNFYCEADLLYLPPAVPAHSVSVEMLNLSDKIDQLQKEVGWSIAEMNDSIKSLSAKAVPTVTNGHSLRTAMTSPPATASKDDLARRANIVVFGVRESQSMCKIKPGSTRY